MLTAVETVGELVLESDASLYVMRASLDTPENEGDAEPDAPFARLLAQATDISSLYPDEHHVYRRVAPLEGVSHDLIAVGPDPLPQVDRTIEAFATRTVNHHSRTVRVGEFSLDPTAPGGEARYWSVGHALLDGLVLDLPGDTPYRVGLTLKTLTNLGRTLLFAERGVYRDREGQHRYVTSTERLRRTMLTAEYKPSDEG